MNKLVLSCALLGAMLFCAFAQEPQAADAKTAQSAVEAVDKEALRAKRKQQRAEFAARMKQHQAAIREKVIEAIKAAGITDESKAAALADQLDSIYRAKPPRPPRPPREKKERPIEAPKAE